MRWGKLATCLGVLFVLSGCAHHLYFQGRTSGAQGTATVVTNAGQGHAISILLNGKTYTGQWVYVPNGGSITFANAFATSGAATASAFGTGYNMPVQGNGSILASAPDGASLRCVFNYSQWNNEGTGICQDSAGETYDLQID